MINKKIILSVIIVLLIGFAAAGYQVTTKTPGLWQPTTSTSQSQSSTGDSSQTSAGTSSQGDVQSQSTGTSSEGSQTGGSTVKISSSAAKTAAQNAIDKDLKGVKAGTPKLSSDGTYYTVPVIDNGKVTGEIEVDAKTGVVTGGTA
jgi:uncharacterized membrane protein YkoI